MAVPDSLDLRLDRFAPRLSIKQSEGRRLVRCLVRRSWLVLQPEEFVRQLWLHFLLNDMKYSANRLTVERAQQIDRRDRRSDILVFDWQMRPFMLIECKAPQVRLGDPTFRQAATYNGPLQAPYLVISNGRQTYICAMDYERGSYRYLKALPEYPPRS